MEGPERGWIGGQRNGSHAEPGQKTEQRMARGFHVQDQVCEVQFQAGERAAKMGRQRKPRSAASNDVSDVKHRPHQSATCRAPTVRRAQLKRGRDAQPTSFPAVVLSSLLCAPRPSILPPILSLDSWLPQLAQHGPRRRSSQLLQRAAGLLLSDAKPGQIPTSAAVSSTAASTSAPVWSELWTSPTAAEWHHARLRQLREAGL